MSDNSSRLEGFDADLVPNSANYRPMSPLSFLRRSARVYANKTAVIHGSTRYSYLEFYQRCRRLASALSQHGVRPGDTVSLMSPNTPPLLEAHYGVPMAGAILNALNYRLDAKTIAFILDHGEAKVLITDRELSPTISKALEILDKDLLVIDIDDPLSEGGELLGSSSYEDFIASGDSEFNWTVPDDDWQSLSLCYTSGTTGNPKGVVYHHRGAYLNSLGNAMVFALDSNSVYLWTLPMFHCNGWSYTWAVTAAGGTHVCLRNIDADQVLVLINEHDVTHLCAAPIVLNMLAHAPTRNKIKFARTVEAATGGAAPASSIISAMESMGFRVTHLYGLTETYGPATYCAWQGEWGRLHIEEKAKMMSRQGVRYPTLDDCRIVNPESMQMIPSDGITIGELVLRGNTVMKGYLKNPEATKEVFKGGWFHTGDLGVMHPDGYVEIKDRSKDIIVSGGENISSLEIEEILYSHPQVMEAAVVAKPDQKWGESPCAFIDLKPGSEEIPPEEIVQYCRENMAHFKVPGTVVFGPLPKTSTGKIQKFVLRGRAKNMGNGEKEQ